MKAKKKNTDVRYWYLIRTIIPCYDAIHIILYYDRLILLLLPWYYCERSSMMNALHLTTAASKQRIFFQFPFSSLICVKSRSEGIYVSSIRPSTTWRLLLLNTIILWYYNVGLLLLYVVRPSGCLSWTTQLNRWNPSNTVIAGHGSTAAVRSRL